MAEQAWMALACYSTSLASGYRRVRVTMAQQQHMAHGTAAHGTAAGTANHTAPYNVHQKSEGGWGWGGAPAHGRDFGDGAHREGGNVAEGGDGDGEAGAVEELAEALVHRDARVALIDLLERPQDDKQVVDADAEQDERQHLHALRSSRPRSSAHEDINALDPYTGAESRGTAERCSPPLTRNVHLLLLYYIYIILYIIFIL